jgi:tetratricopeptide (TPR) repeat protein
LGESELAMLVDSLALDGLSGARLAPVLLRHTGGNPMYVLETLKSLVVEGAPRSTAERLPLPATVAGLIERRLRQLSAPALALARVAAIAGGDFTVELAAQVLQQRVVDLADPWAELEAAQIVREEAFAHDLIFETTLATVPGAVARRLHGEVAAWLEQHAGEPARIAAHWQAAGQHQSAGCHWRRAADAAKVSSRHGEQAAFLEQAIAAFRHVGDVAAEVDCLEALIVALVYVDIGPRLGAAIERATALVSAPEQRLRILLASAYAEQNCGRYEPALRLAREALQLSAELGQPAAGFGAARTLAVTLTTTGRPQEALAIFEQHRGWVEVHGTAENRCEFASDRSWPLLALGRLAEARDSFEQALAIAIELDNVADINAVLNLLAGTEARMGLCRQALAHSEQAIRLHDRLGAENAASNNDYLLCGLIRARLGRYRDALQSLTHALSGFEAVGAERYADSARFELARIFVELGQLARAQRIAAPMRVVDAAAAAPRHWNIEALLAEAAGADPRPHYERLVALLGASSGSSAYNTREVAQLYLARAGDPPKVLSELNALAAAAEQHHQLGLLIAVLARRAQASRANPQLAAADVRRALGLLHDYEPEGIYRAELWAVAAEVLAAAGAADEARAAMLEGVRWVETTAREHVPDEFRDSFLNRNPVNRELLRAASRGRLAAN